MICYGNFTYLGICEKTGANKYLVGTQRIIRIHGKLKAEKKEK